MSDLSGALAKIKRANKHISDLGAEKTRFLNTRPYSATPEYYPDHNQTVYFLDHFSPTPPCIPLIAGDAAHNLRSALDLLAWALYRRANKKGSGTHIYFPITETPEKYKSQSGGKVKGISITDTQAIDAIKPYGGGNDDLWGLHQLDIADKHKLLPTPVIGIGRFGFHVTAEMIEREFKGFIKFSPGSFEDKTVWFDAPPNSRDTLAFKPGDPVAAVAGDRELHKDVELTFDIAFGEPEVFKGRPIFETLVQLSNLVEGIVNSFSLP